MKRLFICATALGLFAATPALSAQDNNHGNKHNTTTQNASHGSGSAGGHQNNQGRAMTGGTHTKTVGTFQNMPSGPSMGAAHTTSFGTHQNTPTAVTTGNRYLPVSGNTHQSLTGHSTVDTTRARSGTFTNSVQNHPSINSLRLNVQASRQFHNGSYNAPQGYQSRHWGYGDRLPRGYFVSDYWIVDYLMFDLFTPPDGLIWVRVGDDALLIDRYSGDIVQVDYSVFY